MRLIDADLFISKVEDGTYIYLQADKEDVIDAVNSEPTINGKTRLIIKNHMETCENCECVMPMMNDYYRAKLKGCPYCLSIFTNL